jgi:hypothetical protein
MTLVDLAGSERRYCETSLEGGRREREAVAIGVIVCGIGMKSEGEG